MTPVTLATRDMETTSTADFHSFRPISRVTEADEELAQSVNKLATMFTDLIDKLKNKNLITE